MCLLVRVVVVAALQVTEQDIANIVAQWTGIPIEKVSADETERLIKMEEVLHGRVIGQVCMCVARVCGGAVLLVLCSRAMGPFGSRVSRPEKGGQGSFAAFFWHNTPCDAVAALTTAVCYAVVCCVQEEAVSAISRAIRRARVGLKNPNRPIASFIFAGPTGVGKSELAKTLASYYFGSEDAMVRRGGWPHRRAAGACCRMQHFVCCCLCVVASFDLLVSLL